MPEPARQDANPRPKHAKKKGSNRCVLGRMLTTKEVPASHFTRHHPAFQQGDIDIGTTTRHLQQSHRYFDLASYHIAANEPLQGWDALRRSATHAVTAAAVHWRLSHHSRRRLITALEIVIFDCALPRSHLRAFRELCLLTPKRIEAMGPRVALQTLFRLRRRMRRLIARLERVIAAKPEIPTMEYPLPLPPRPSSASGPPTPVTVTEPQSSRRPQPIVECPLPTVLPDPAVPTAISTLPVTQIRPPPTILDNQPQAS